MTTESLAKIIDDVNTGAENDRIYQRALLDNVCHAKVWTEYPTGECINEEGYVFYFVYSENGHCIAAIFVMGTVDLHVFVKEEHRRHGVMSRALENVVLPHLFLDERRKEQKATFNSMEARSLLEKVGFEIIDDKMAVIKKDKVKAVDFPESYSIPFPKDRMKAMQKRARIATALLRMVNDEISMYSCGDLSEYIDLVAEDADNVSYRVEDEWWKCCAPKE